MMKYLKMFLILVAASASFGAAGVENCVTSDEQTPYSGEITQESRDVGFNNCPESLLVNEKYVANLFSVKDAAGDSACGYKLGYVAFYCENN